MTPGASPPALDVSVCICTRNRPDDLREALASVAASRPRPLEVVVADDGDGGLGGVLPAAEPVPVRYVTGPHSGLGANRNAAVAAARGEYLLFLDDDARLAPDFLAKIATRIGRLPAGERARTIVTGAEINGELTVEPNEQDLLGFQSRRYREGEPLRTVVINATLFPRALFDEVAFDPRLRYGFDEVDVSTQAVARGYPIASCFDAANLHLPADSGREAYAAAASASRLYVTLKRRRWTEGSRLRGWSGFALGAAHVCAASVKRAGARAGLREGSQAVRRALAQHADFVAAEAPGRTAR